VHSAITHGRLQWLPPSLPFGLPGPVRRAASLGNPRAWDAAARVKSQGRLQVRAPTQIPPGLAGLGATPALRQEVRLRAARRTAPSQSSLVAQDSPRGLASYRGEATFVRKARSRRPLCKARFAWLSAQQTLRPRFLNFQFLVEEGQPATEHVRKSAKPNIGFLREDAAVHSHPHRPGAWPSCDAAGSLTSIAVAPQAHAQGQARNHGGERK